MSKDKISDAPADLSDEALDQVEGGALRPVATGDLDLDVAGMTATYASGVDDILDTTGAPTAQTGSILVRKSPDIIDPAG
jgi:threonine dehydrogenase-like Zn-dependent dehydrogenase